MSFRNRSFICGFNRMNNLYSSRKTSRSCLLITTLMESYFNQEPISENSIIKPNNSLFKYNKTTSSIIKDKRLSPLVSALSNRKSSRSFSKKSVSFETIKTLAHIGYGSMSKNGNRTVPSAGAYYPLTMWICRINGNFINSIYKFHPENHEFENICNNETKFIDIFDARSIDYKNANWLIVWTTNIVPIASRYGSRAIRYFLLEAGHSAQNISIGCCLLDIGHIMLGGFDDYRLRKELLMQKAKVRPIYTMLIG